MVISGDFHGGFLMANSELMDIYHLVMTNSLPWKITMLLIRKPSISIRAIYTMAMLNNQRVKPNLINHKTTGR